MRTALRAVAVGFVAVVVGVGAAAPSPAQNMPDAGDLIGNKAPELGLELLDGGKVSLASHVGKDVVVLDFWATWCPPCVKGLPLVSQVCAEFKDKGVVFYAVNLQEEPEKIRAFLKSKQLDVKVALDTRAEAATTYGAGAIPHTVVIARDGKVASVHTGFAPGTEKQLREELAALVENKALGGAAPDAGGAVNKGDPGDTMVAEALWSQRGGWSAVAAYPGQDAVYALDDRGTVVRLDRRGERSTAIRLKQQRMFGSTLRLANLAGDGEPEFVLHQLWGQGVQAFGRDGAQLWTYPGNQGVDDVWTADLDGARVDAVDQFDEVIIGFNGSGGVHAVNADGKPRWKNNEIGNVWHVTAGFADARGVPTVVTTSARGQVHFFSADTGAQLAFLPAAGYAGLVRLATIKPDADPVVVTEVDNGAALSCMERSGKKLWKTPMGPRGGRLADGIGAPNHPWFACPLEGGEVLVIDVTTGKTLVTVQAGGAASVAWLPGKDGEPPVLVVAGGGKVTAYKLKVKAP